MQEMPVRSLGGEDPLEKGMATHSCILAWEIPMGRGAWQATAHGVEKSRTQRIENCVLCLVIQSLWADLPSEPPGKSQHGTAVYKFSPNLRTYLWGHPVKTVAI